VSDELRLLGFTLGVATAATLAILPFGVGLAYALARWRGPGRALAETLVSLPLVLPPTAVGLVLLELCAKSGPLGRLFDVFGLEVLFTWKAVVLASAVMSFPLLCRSARTAFEAVDPRLPGIARTLGRGPLYVFARVTAPLAWRGIAAGTLLAFSRALGEFGATILVAGNIPGRTQTMALAIFHHAQLGHDREALALCGVAALIAFVALYATERIGRAR
jgi:molybdate transport system permease protein